VQRSARALSRDKRIIVADAATEEALERWVQRFGLADDILWIGSAGLARSIAGMLANCSSGVSLSGNAMGKIERQTVSSGPACPALVVVGSVHPACRDQVAFLLSRPDVAPVAVYPAHIIQERVSLDQTVARIVQAFHRGRPGVLYTETSDEAQQELVDTLVAAGYDMDRASERISRWLGQVVAHAVEVEPDLAGLVLTGGDTARAVMLALGVLSLSVIGAVAPGVPIGQTFDRRLRLVTKAGGFGGRDILLRAAQTLGR